MKGEWIHVNLGEIVDIRKGGVSEQSNHPQKGYLPIINTDFLRGDIKLWGEVKGSVLCEETDVLILWDGERSGLCSIGHAGVVGSTFAKMTVSKDVDPKFLFRVIDFNFNWIQNHRTGTGVPHVPKDLTKILEIGIPPLPQQRKIARILSTCDAVIEKTEAAIAKYGALKQGLMHDLFTRGIDNGTGKLRPPREEVPELYKKTELGWVPKEWEVRSLADVANLRHGYQFRDFDFVEEGIDVVKIGQVGREGRVDLSNAGKIANSRLKEFKDIELFNGDILMALTGATLGKTAMIRDIEKPMVQNYRVGYFGPKDLDCLNKDFLYFLLIGESVQNEILGFINAGAQGNIGKADFEKIEIIVPKSIKEQKLVSERLLTLEVKIDIERSTLSKYREIKSGLMQDLLTGKVEVEKMSESGFTGLVDKQDLVDDLSGNSHRKDIG